MSRAGFLTEEHRRPVEVRQRPRFHVFGLTVVEEELPISWTWAAARALRYNVGLG